VVSTKEKKSGLGGEWKKGFDHVVGGGSIFGYLKKRGVLMREVGLGKENGVGG